MLKFKPMKLIIGKRSTTVTAVLCALLIEGYIDISRSESQDEILTPEVASICSGEHLVINCSTTRDFLEWNVTVLKHNSERISRTRLVASTGQFNPNLVVANKSFYIEHNNNTGSIMSNSNILALTLSITQVTVDLNGTEVKCTEVGNSLQEKILLITTLQVIQSNQVQSVFSSVERHVLIYGTNNVTVILTWRPILELDNVIYNISVSPTISNSATRFTNNSAVQLILAYNSSYNVSIVATLCEMRSSINFTGLKYVRCEDPSNEVSTSGVRVVGYHDPAVERTTVTLECLAPEMVLTGPSTITCSDNGLWQPNSRETMCRRTCGPPSVNSDVISWRYNSSFEGLVIYFWCNESPTEILTAVCNEDGTWSPAPANDSVLLCSTTAMSMNAIPIIGSSVGISFGALLIVGGIIVVFVLTILKKRGSQLKMKPQNNGMDQETPNNQQSEYSLLEHTKPTGLSRNTTTENESSLYSVVEHPVSEQESLRQTITTETKGTIGHSEGALLYADIGPLSIKRQPCISTLNQEDQRVEYSLLNFKAHKKESSHEMDCKVDTMDSSADGLLNLDSLLIQLQAEVTPKWYQFGVAVGVDKETLNKYREYPDNQCIIEVLDIWLRNHTGRPTWREVADVLRGIGLRRLASDIERVYETGRLPIEVNMEEVDIDEISHDALAGSPEETPPPIPPRCS